MNLKLAHISDVHLGAKLLYLRTNADDHRNNIKNAFENSINIAILKKVDVFIIAGDLFDSPFPSRNLQNTVLDQIKKLIGQGIYVALISGNHDGVSETGVYNVSAIKDFKDSHFKLKADEKQEDWIIPELNVRIALAGISKKKNNKTPYETLETDSKYAYNIGVFHGSADIKGPPMNNPIYLADLKKSGLDYIALGDWHNTLEVAKGVRSWYSGSPELIDSDQTNAGNMLIITLGDKKELKVEIEKTGLKTAQFVKVDVSQYKTYEELVAVIKTKKNKDLILNLTLEGFKSIEYVIKDEELKDVLAGDFYHINIVDKTALKLNKEELNAYPANMIIGRYIKLLNEKRVSGDEVLNAKIDEAIQLGVGLMKGGQL